jgi:katanin p80 WD40 repeat-containing subunit B1
VHFFVCKQLFQFVIDQLLNVSVLRTLTGHKSSIKSLDFHPYGDYAASGSQDSTIKVFIIP